MRNNFISKAGMVIVLFLLVCTGICPAQTAEYTGYLKKVSAVVGNPALNYRYRVLLVENKSGKVVDSMSGTLYKSGNDYLDSNATMISLVSGNYFFKADKKGKYAYVYDLAVVGKKMGIKREEMNNTFLSIPDSLLSKMGSASLDKSSDKYIGIRYTLKAPVNGMKDMLFRLNKKDESLAEIKMEIAEEDKWGDATGYRRVYYLYGFSNNLPKDKFNTNSYFRKEAKQVKLQGIYKSYKLSSLL